jgi:uncharacterized protein GlcG (DUF336 family)
MSISDTKKIARAAFAGALKALIGVGMATLLCSNAGAQASAKSTANAPGLVTQKNLSLPIAKTIAEAALAECQAKGYHTAVAVVDRAGQVMVILRDELATAQHADMARRKAYTARMFRIPTSEFQKRTADSSYAAQRNLPDVLALGGGVPIQVGNETIGGVASAGSTQEQDEACAKAGVGKVTDLLK